MLNPIFSKKVQGQKHPGRWGLVEHQIPSIKVLFKTNTKGHKHPCIRLLLVNQRKQKVAFSPGTANSPEIQFYRTWWGAASPILNDTPVVYIRPITELIYIYIYMITQFHITWFLPQKSVAKNMAVAWITSKLQMMEIGWLTMNGHWFNSWLVIEGTPIFGIMEIFLETQMYSINRKRVIPWRK